MAIDLPETSQSDPMKTVIIVLSLSLLCHFSYSQIAVDYGKSYVNITKGTGGGTNEPGDVLEIRATFVVTAGTAYQCGYTDNIPAGTSYIPGTLRVLTNEGKIFRQWTDASDADAGTILGTTITINLGKGATAISGGSIKNTNKPSVAGSSCIMVASYRVQVNPASGLGTVVNVGGGSFVYSNAVAPAALTTVTFSADSIMLYKNYGICPNTVGSNAIISEFGGTFGSGVLKDRAPSIKVPANYIYTPFGANSPDDYYYGVSNNTSPGGSGYSTVNTWTIPDPHRVFGTWDVIGDHTNAINPLLGNPATDTTSGPGGYMVVINASYRTDTAFKDIVTNLCPNTYYQYTAWLRNIGPKGGDDSNGVTAISGNNSYIPTGPGDSSGVHPNLTFNANGYDYYTTGDIPYTGQWIQKGFTFKTGPTQNQMTIYIRNNAPGGGGNDWAIDDISVASCSPNLALTPAKPDTLCQGTVDTIGFKISSYFAEYSQWQVEESFDGGTTWAVAGTDTAGQSSVGTSTPVFNPSTGQYEYNVNRYYRLDAINTLILFRIRVASSATNLSTGNCSFSATTSKIVHAVNCNLVLPVSILAFKGKLQDGLAHLQWISGDEMADTKYVIERSRDKSNFETAGTVSGQAGVGSGNVYYFTDPAMVSGPTYYRIRISSGSLSKYSNVVLLSNSDLSTDISTLVNPFTDKISFDLTVSSDDRAVITLVDAYGRIIKRQNQSVTRGLNNIVLPGLEGVCSGMYVLQVKYAGGMISRQVIKKSFNK